MKEKPHYILLDGLRGVAALMVLVFHVFDVCSSNIIPHGYLAVDLFFVLSGFVIGYAYDDRWQQGLTAGQFFRRRLIRLHPMVLVGGLLGDISYPLYAIHYPFMLILFGCLGFNGELIDPHFVATQWPLAVTIVVVSPLLAWLLFKYYDQPFRRWLSRKWERR